MAASLEATSFHLDSNAQRKLDVLVDKIEAKPGDLIDLAEFEQRQCNLNVKAVLGSLPPGLSGDDLAGILKLALLTECATESYASMIRERARLSGAGWLGRFNDRVWAPDELTHHAPYKMFLLNLGFAECELDREIKETQDKQYVHFGGETPIHITTFGMIQEYLTDNWHGLISKLLREASPEAAYMAMRIKRRETLHTVWYRDMTALQIEANPRYVRFVAEEVERFRMPGESLVPELQAKGPGWQQLMGADFEKLFRDLLRLVQETLVSTRLTGELVMHIAAEKNIKLGPIPAPHLSVALERLGGPGYGILGEAVLERAGLSYMFKGSTERQDSGYRPYAHAYERIRSLVRTWIAEHIPAPDAIAMGTA